MEKVSEAEMFKAIVEGFVDPVVFVNSDHVIQYMNPAGMAKYEARGGGDLVGQSIFDCHNEASNRMIREIFQDFVAGTKDDQFLSVGRGNKRVYMRAVRDAGGEVIGYYERYEDKVPANGG